MRFRGTHVHHKALKAKHTRHAPAAHPNAAHELRFKARHHMHAAKHHVAKRRGATLDPFYAKHASFIELADSPQQQLSDNSPQSPLSQLTSAAQTIEMRFKQAEGDKAFGKGLDKDLVNSVKSDSEEFWKDVRSLSPQDTQDMSQEDAQALQQVVQQVAQMDDDLNNAKRSGMVQNEYDTIKKELADAGI